MNTRHETGIAPPSPLRIEIPFAQIPVPGARSRLRLVGRDIALFNVGDTLYAIDDSCPHQGSSLLAGTLSGRLVQCRAHGLRFDLASGLMPGAAGFGVMTYPIERDGERAFIHLPDGDAAETAREA